MKEVLQVLLQILQGFPLGPIVWELFEIPDPGVPVLPEHVPRGTHASSVDHPLSHQQPPGARGVRRCVILPPMRTLALVLCLSLVAAAQEPPADDARRSDDPVTGNATEFSIPAMGAYAIVDLIP